MDNSAYVLMNKDGKLFLGYRVQIIPISSAHHIYLKGGQFSREPDYIAVPNDYDGWVLDIPGSDMKLFFNKNVESQFEVLGVL